MPATCSRLRPAVDADMPALAELWVGAWQATLPEIDFASRRGWLIARLTEYRQAGVAVLCAVDAADRPHGFITVDCAAGHIDQLAVAPASFGAGVATTLLAEARRLSPQGLRLEVNQQNPRAMRFYQGEGFAITGAGTIGSPPRPIWLMHWCPIPP